MRSSTRPLPESLEMSSMQRMGGVLHAAKGHRMDDAHGEVEPAYETHRVPW